MSFGTLPPYHFTAFGGYSSGYEVTVFRGVPFRGKMGGNHREVVIFERFYLIAAGTDGGVSYTFNGTYPFVAVLTLPPYPA